MSAKGTLPEADSARGAAPNSPLAKLARLFVGWTSHHPLKIIIAFVILTAVSGALRRPAFCYQYRRQCIDLGRSALAATGAGLRVGFSAKHARRSSRSSTRPRRNWPTPPRPPWPISCRNTTDFSARSRSSAGEGFLRAMALLFLDMPELTATLTQLEGASPSLAILAADPSLRGLIQAFSLSLGAAQMGMFDSMPQTLNQLADTVESVLAGRPTSFSWKEFLQERAGKAGRQAPADRNLAETRLQYIGARPPGDGGDPRSRRASEPRIRFSCSAQTDRTRSNRRPGIRHASTRRFD